MADAPVPGWYPDPSNAAAEWRWWDGRSWTDETAPRRSAERPRRAQDWGWDTPREPAVTFEAPAVEAAVVKDAVVAPTTANTPWIWLLAFSFLIYGAIAGLLQGIALTVANGDVTTSQLIGAGGLVVALIPLVVLAELDGRALRKRELPAPSALWIILLAPIAYFVVRARKLKAAGARSRGPEIALIIVVIVQVITIVATVVLAYSLIQAFLPGSPAIG